MIDIDYKHNKDISLLKETAPSNTRTGYLGVVYAISWGESIVKIGMTKNPYLRINTLISLAKNYSNVEVSRIIVSDYHTNYSENEFILHSLFSEYRIAKGELFKVDMQEVICAIQNLEYKDDSEDMEQKDIMYISGLMDYADPNQMFHGQKTSESSTSDSNDNINMHIANKFAEAIVNITDETLHLTGFELRYMIMCCAKIFPVHAKAFQFYVNKLKSIDPNRKYRVFIFDLKSDNDDSTDSSDWESDRAHEPIYKYEELWSYDPENFI